MKKNNYLRGQKFIDNKLSRDYTFFHVKDVCEVFYIVNNDRTDVFFGTTENGYLTFNVEKYQSFNDVDDLIEYNEKFFKHFDNLYFYKSIPTHGNTNDIVNMCINIDIAQTNWDDDMYRNILEV